MSRNRSRPDPQEDPIRPEVHEQIHRSDHQARSAASLGTPAASEGGRKARRSKPRRIFWSVMIFFAISATASYLDSWINVGG